MDTDANDMLYEMMETEKEIGNAWTKKLKIDFIKSNVSFIKIPARKFHYKTISHNLL